jgi:SAM-dependent methyltransferase
MKDDTVNYYRARAAEYEQIYYREVPARRKELADDVTRLSPLATGRNVLEFACGTGYWTHVMSETARHITAVDISAEMLAEARKKPLGCPVEFMEGDMFAQALPPHSFDLIALGFWFSHQPRQEYNKLFDLLDLCRTPDARIWLIDNNPPAEGHNTDSAGTDSFGNNYKQRFLNDGTSYVILKNYFSRDELTEIFARRYRIDQLMYGTYYWSVVLRGRHE